MEEKMFRCLIHHQCDIVKSIPLRSVGTVNVAMILVRSGAERSGAERGNIEWLEKLQCSHHCQKHSAPLRWNWESIDVYPSLSLGAERNGER